MSFLQTVWTQIRLLLFRSSLIWVHTVCRYAKNSFEKFARIFSRRHKQTTFSDRVFLGALRVNLTFNQWVTLRSQKRLRKMYVKSFWLKFAFRFRRRRKKVMIDFEDGGHSGQFGFLILTILANFDLQVTTILSTKFPVTWTFGSGEWVQNS